MRGGVSFFADKSFHPRGSREVAENFMQARGRLDEGNEFNKSSLGSHMLATLPEGESKDSARSAFRKEKG